MPHKCPQGLRTHFHPYQSTGLSPKTLPWTTGWGDLEGRSWRWEPSWPPSCFLWSRSVLISGLQVWPVSSFLRLQQQISKAGAPHSHPNCLLPEVELSTGESSSKPHRHHKTGTKVLWALPPTTPSRALCCIRRKGRGSNI